MGRNQAGKNFAAREKKRCQKRLEDEIVASLAVTSDEATGVAAPQGPALTLQGVLGVGKSPRFHTQCHRAVRYMPLLAFSM